MTDKTNKTRRCWPTFLGGAAATLIIVCIVVLYREYDNIGKPQVLNNGDAHVRFLERGVPVPNSAKDLYYFYLEGFTNYREYFSFSTDLSDARAVAQTCAKRVVKNPIFTNNIQSTQWFVNDGPGHDNPKWKTPLWNLNSVKNGELFEDKQLFVLVDIDNSRVYISTWGNFDQSEKFPFGIPRLSPDMAWYLNQCLEKK